MPWTDLKPLARFEAGQPDYKLAKARSFLAGTSGSQDIASVVCVEPYVPSCKKRIDKRHKVNDQPTSK